MHLQMLETETHIEKVKEQQTDIWNDTIKQLKRQDQHDPETLPPTRSSPQTLRKAPDKNLKNKFKRNVDRLVSVSAAKADYVEGVGDRGQKYSGSLYEAFMNGTTNDVQLPCKNVETDVVVPCAPDIFLKIACTDDISPYGARQDDQ